MDDHKEAPEIGVSEADQGRDLEFFTIDKNETPTDEQKRLSGALDDLVSRLYTLFYEKGDSVRFNRYYQRVILLARGTVSGPYPNPEGCFQEIERITSEILRVVGPKVREEYQKRMLKAAMFAAAILMGGALLVRASTAVAQKYGLVETAYSETTPARASAEQADAKTTPASENPGPSGNARPRKVLLNSVQWDPRFSALHMGLLLSVSMFGIWAGVAARGLEPTFELIDHPDDDLMAPWARLVFYGSFITVFALLMHLEAFSISLGNLSTRAILDNVIVTIPIGFGLGLLHVLLPDAVEKKLAEALGLKKKNPVGSSQAAVNPLATDPGQ